MKDRGGYISAAVVGLYPQCVGYEDHPIFQKPPDDTPIWRYMDFTKFVALLHTGSLYFSRADLLGDPFEGSYSRANVLRRPEVYAELGDKFQTFLQQATTFSAALPRWTHLNCWHVNTIESAAMWGLYTDKRRGIAIRSTVGRLVRSLSTDSHRIYVGLVTYIDYRTEWMPESNSMYPFIHKRRSYDFERELRALIQDLPVVNDALDLAGSGTPSIQVPTALRELVERVFVSPSAPEWFVDLVRSVALRYNSTLVVDQSDMSGDPVY